MSDKPKNILDRPLEYLKGVSATRAKLLREELSLHTYDDLLRHYPFRYVDKTQFHKIAALTEDDDHVQLKGVLRQVNVMGEGRKKRLVARLRDETGMIELVWFRGVHFIQKQLTVGMSYVVYGRINVFGSRLNLPHPEVEAFNGNAQEAATLAPIYSTTDKLSNKNLNAKGLRRLTKTLLDQLAPADLPENLPQWMIEKLRFPSRYDAMQWIHFPPTQGKLHQARRRLKYEELFFVQLRLLRSNIKRKQALAGFHFEKVGAYFNTFYHEKLPFELTGAQKRVLKEIRADVNTGAQMNRLLQGDVGSGKTVVGFMTMLMALDNGYQAIMMAPTEILAQQHYAGISEMAEGQDIEVAFLSGSVKGRKRKDLLERLEAGQINILIGTHALIEPWVVFKNLGLVLIDEQHRFGVAQRAALWKKSHPYAPHVLVMTATPIPRTLAMTLYGDLDVSVIDELPPGRKPIQTLHKYESGRLRVFGFMRNEIDKGHQVYVVYPLIEESQQLDLHNLEQGHESLQREFPQPKYQISVVHGKMKATDKDFEMQRFVRGETQIMVATTVIEVGVNVPNASVMVIENTERFGLSQLHQLRGRVGRGADQSYCILMSSYKLSKDGRERIKTMVDTTDGFRIAEADLKLRGPGSMEGTRQSGMISLQLADLTKDQAILKVARDYARAMLEQDPDLQLPEHAPVRAYIMRYGKRFQSWARIS